MTQEVLFLLCRRNFGLKRNQLCLRLPQRTPMRPKRFQFSTKARVVIQNLAMPPWIEQATVIMLAMQFYQSVRQAAQHFTAGTPVIDPRGLAAIGRVHASEDQFAFGLNAHIFQHRLRRMSLRQIKPSGHFPLLGALAHQFSPPAPAEHKPKRIQKDRLTGTRFTGKHIETGLKLKFKPLNNQHVPNIEPA